MSVLKVNRSSISTVPYNTARLGSFFCDAFTYGGTDMLLLKSALRFESPSFCPSILITFFSIISPRNTISTVLILVIGIPPKLTWACMPYYMFH